MEFHLQRGQSFLREKFCPSKPVINRGNGSTRYLDIFLRKRTEKTSLKKRNRRKEEKNGGKMQKTLCREKNEKKNNRRKKKGKEKKEKTTCKKNKQHLLLQPLLIFFIYSELEGFTHDFFLLKSSLFLGNGQFKEALTNAQQACQLKPKDPAVRTLFPLFLILFSLDFIFLLS